MKTRILLILCFALLLCRSLSAQSTDNTLSVKNFKGSDVAAKLASAMLACDPSISCILVLDPSLAAWAQGTLPTLCPKCSLLDYRNGVISGGGGTGPIGPAGPPGGSLSYPGVLSNGNGLAVSGIVAAGGANPVIIGGATGSCTGKIAMADGTGCATNGGLPGGGLTGQVATAASAGTAQGWGYGSAYFSSNGLTMFGDSNSTLTGGGAAAGYSYASLLALKYGKPFTDYALPGDMAADDVAFFLYPNINPSIQGNVPVTITTGANDALLCGATTGCENNYYHSLLSGVGWAAIPYEYKIQPQLGIASGNCTTTGTWTNLTYAHVSAIQSIVPGSTITCTSLNAGDPAVYANWYAADALTSTATFAIDGTTVDTWNAFGFNGQAIYTGSHGQTSTPFATRYALTGSGTHTYKVTVGTAGAGNAFTFLWIGSPMPQSGSHLGGPTVNPPLVVLGGIIRESADARGAACAAYDALAKSISTAFLGDGAYVPFINFRAYVDLDYATLDSDMSPATLPNGLVTPTSLSPGLHPNGGVYNGVLVGGTPHMAAAFEAVFPPPPLPSAGSSVFTVNAYTANHTLMLSDGISYFNGASITLTLPALADSGPYFIFNYNSTPLSITFGSGALNGNGNTGPTVPTTLALGQGFTIYVTQGIWFLADGSKISPANLNFQIANINANANMTAPYSSYAINGSGVTLTMLPLTNLGPYTIFNYGTSAATLAAGTGTFIGGCPTNLPAHSGLVITFLSGLCEVAGSWGFSPTYLNLAMAGHSSNYTLVATDANVYLQPSSPMTLTLPNLGTAGPIFISNIGTATVTIAASGSTLEPGVPSTLPPGSGVVLFAFLNLWMTANTPYTLPTLPASLTTTAATSNTLTVTGMTSSGYCSLTATNASAATNIATTYISAKAANQITVTHTATAGMTYDAVCTSN